ncbi:cytochrome P450 [Kitasatospora sp. NA04385]|uniref:cytochrome P450 family protein n=1 Tax=Kitasatospora sp. NA04385 TaxID=2742135 RepID=UPI0011622569|nr:cytochrome P450 [Kitasatospora sp. NA04385]QDJ74279.1 cytochrome P450 [Kitasatospora sp.]QKW22411.1 cytochrome P450 [Kitasatospora sp. NA04385]
MSETNTASATLLTPDFIQNPYPLFAQLSEQGPTRMAMYPGGPETWVVTRYEDVRQVLADPTVLKDPRNAPDILGGGGQGEDDLEAHPELALVRHMLNSDQAEHARLRKLVGKAFTARPVKGLGPAIEEIVADVLDGLPTGEPVDLVERFALPVTVRTICGMLGIPVADQASFAHQFNTVTNISDPAEMSRAAGELVAYLTALLDEKRRNPDEAMISELIAVSDGDDAFSQAELVSMIFLLLGAGHESTNALITNAVLALIDHPEEKARVAKDLDLVPALVEETLRYDAPFHLATFRYTTEPIEVGGVTIPARESVLTAIGGANHDARHLGGSGAFDLDTAGPGRHLAFGHGVHHCLGAPLARLEGAAALTALLGRHPGFSLAVDRQELQYRPSLLVRGLVALPVVL